MRGAFTNEGLRMAATDHPLTAVFEPCEEGGYHAFIKEIPGVHSEGDSLEAAQINLMDALHTLLVYRMEKALKNADVPKDTRFEAQLAA
jgi:predicted RNase H-like HicB family nuclease